MEKLGKKKKREQNIKIIFQLKNLRRQTHCLLTIGILLNLKKKLS